MQSLFQTLFYVLMLVLTYTFIQSLFIKQDLMEKYVNTLETENQTGRVLLCASKKLLDMFDNELNEISESNERIVKNNKIIENRLKEITVNLNVKQEKQFEKTSPVS